MDSDAFKLLKIDLDEKSVKFRRVDDNQMFMLSDDYE